MCHRLSPRETKARLCRDTTQERTVLDQHSSLHSKVLLHNIEPQVTRRKTKIPDQHPGKIGETSQLVRSSIAAAAGVPLVSWSASDGALSLAHSQTRPFFVRTLPLPSSQGQSMWAWVTYYAVPFVSFFYTREPLGQGLFQVVQAGSSMGRKQDPGPHAPAQKIFLLLLAWWCGCEGKVKWQHREGRIIAKFPECLRLRFSSNLRKPCVCVCVFQNLASDPAKSRGLDGNLSKVF